MRSSTKYIVNDLRDMKVYGPFASDNEACIEIEQLGLGDEEYFVTEHVTEIREIDFKHQLSMFRHKKKKGNEVTYEDSKQITIAGEIVG